MQKNVTQKNNMSPKDRRWESKDIGNMSERCAAQANAPPAGSDEYPEQRPPPSPGAESERKRRVRGRWPGGSHYFRDYLGSIDGGVVIGFGGVFPVYL